MLIGPKTTVRRVAIEALDRCRLRDPARFARSAVRLLSGGNLGRELSVRRRRTPTPLPSAWLLYLVQERLSWQAFDADGQQSVEYLRRLLVEAGLDFGARPRVLDFGCGCGRILRWWGEEAAAYGCDYDPRLVAWCAAHLPNVPVVLNTPLPPLPFETGFFDALYAQSVLTHLPPEVQAQWMADWARVVRPGGVLVVTTHGPSHLGAPDRLARLQQAGTLTVSPKGVGNLCGVWNMPGDVTHRLGRDLELVSHRPQDMPASNQDVSVFRVPRPPAPPG